MPISVPPVLRPLAILVGCVLVLAACAETGSDTTPAPTVDPVQQVTESTTAPAPETPDGETVLVLDVLDGDSLAVQRDGGRTEVRLAGINTPERDECYGDEARTAATTLIGDGEVVLVEVDGDDDQDQFGRLLRHVWVDGVWVNGTLVAEGAAISIQTGAADEETLVTAENAAWEQGLGLWGSAVCGDFPAGVFITDIRYDPPGRDFENTTEEWVLLANEGDAEVDVGGWIVRDESSAHRYVFPEGVVLAPGDGVRLRSGCGADEGRDLYWCAEDAVWSNGGDTVLLQTATGTVVDRWKYRGDF